jgi:hypothetical protein
MNKKQIEIIKIECGCTTTDNKNSVLIEIELEDNNRARLLNMFNEEIIRLKEDSIKRVEDKIDEIDFYIYQYNSIIIFLEKSSTTNISLNWNDKLSYYFILISDMLILQHFKIIPMYQEYYFHTNGNVPKKVMNFDQKIEKG